MLEILRVRQRRGLVAAVAAIGLLAAACGSADTESNEASGGTTARDSAAEPSVDEGGANDGSSTDDGAADDGTAGEPATDDAAGTGEEATSDDGQADGTEEPVVENLFPDLEVVNIADGSSLNLADELGGGDLPVLLWFWAPH